MMWALYGCIPATKNNFPYMMINEIYGSFCIPGWCWQSGGIVLMVVIEH